MANDSQRIENTRTCPVCEGRGKTQERYLYKQQHRYDTGGSEVFHNETCWLCGGANGITRDVYASWEAVESYAPCPACNSAGGKRFWDWQESRKRFTFEPCRVCEGKRRASPAAIALHNRERRRLQVWGIGCTALVVIGGLFIATYGANVLVRGTPWMICCPSPGLVLPGVMLLVGIRHSSSGW